MHSIRKLLFILALILSCGAYTSMAQIEVNIRPERPHYERPAPPSPGHVWIDEEWEPRGGAYVFVGGHWAAPPRPGIAWIPGHWKRRPREWVWIPGHWR